MTFPVPIVRRAATTVAAALFCAAAIHALGGAARRHARRPAAAPAAPGAPAGPVADPLPDGPPCAVAEVARAGAPVTALLEDEDGALWIGTAGRGLLRGGAPGYPPEPVAGLAGRQLTVNALAVRDGLVWAATQGGLVALDEDRRALAVLEGEPIAALAPGRGALWAGTPRGLFRVTVDGGAERVDVAGPAGEPLRPTALAVSGDRLWIGTESGAYVVPVASLEAPLLARTAGWIPLGSGERGADASAVTALAAAPGGAVAGTDDGGLVLLRDGAPPVAVRFADPAANAVALGAAAPGIAGAVLVGTRGGLLVARPGPAGLEVERVPGIGRREVSAAAPAAGGAVAGTPDGAVLRIALGAAVPAS